LRTTEDAHAVAGYNKRKFEKPKGDAMKMIVLLLLLAALLWWAFRLRQADAPASLPVVTEVLEQRT
jgi:hypothetical protein